jgi:hypothetical protein
MRKSLTRAIASAVGIAIINAFFTSNNSAFANDYFDKAFRKEYSYTTEKRILAEEFNTKASDLLISEENDGLSIQLLKYASSVFSNHNVEIGEYSCYLGNSNTTSLYLNNQPIGRFMLSVYTPTQGKRSVSLKSNETILLKPLCNEIVNTGYMLIYKTRQLDTKIIKLRGNLDIQKQVQNPVLELNIKNNWNF